MFHYPSNTVQYLRQPQHACPERSGNIKVGNLRRLICGINQLLYVAVIAQFSLFYGLKKFLGLPIFSILFFNTPQIPFYVPYLL